MLLVVKLKFHKEYDLSWTESVEQVRNHPDRNNKLTSTSVVTFILPVYCILCF
jgi:hypothetical protein